MYSDGSRPGSRMCQTHLPKQIKLETLYWHESQFQDSNNFAIVPRVYSGWGGGSMFYFCIIENQYYNGVFPWNSLFLYHLW